MSITAFAVEALPAAAGTRSFDMLRGEVDEQLEQLVTFDARALDDPLSAASWARQALAKIAAFRLAALAEADRRGAARGRGALGTAAWLRGQGEAAGAARRDVALAGALADDDHARTRAGLAAGRFGPEQAAVITQAKDALSDLVDEQTRTEFEAHLHAAAETMNAYDLRLAARREAARVDPTGLGDLERQEKAQRAQRELRVFKNREGMYSIAGQLDPEGAAVLSTALEPLAAPRPSSVDGPDPRSRGRRLADALVVLAQRAVSGSGLPKSGGVQPEVVVTMTLDQLRGMDGSAAELVGGAVREPISAGRARRLACDATILPVVLGGGSQILDFGTGRRTASEGQRKALALRDRGCTAPGCDAPPSWCEAHHLVPWSVRPNGSLDNLALVCDAHHDLLHQDGWSLRLTSDHRVEWIAPDWSDWPDPPDPVDRPDPLDGAPPDRAP